MADPFELWRLMWSSAISRGLESLADTVPSAAALDRGRHAGSIDLSCLATLKRIRLELPTMLLMERDVQVRAKAPPVLIVAPYAIHEASIADFAEGHSLARVLIEGGSESVALTYWKSATAEMRDYGIDAYLGDLNVAVDDLGGRASLVGLCQGGWLAAAYAARFPRKVARLVLAGAPIDTGAAESHITRTLPRSRPPRSRKPSRSAADGFSDRCPTRCGPMTSCRISPRKRRCNAPANRRRSRSSTPGTPGPSICPAPISCRRRSGYSVRTASHAEHFPLSGA